VLILGIESSCDETAAAVVRDGSVVLSNAIASQYELHAEYGGVVPEIASRAHVERILPIIRRALADAGITLKELNAVAVGHRPGLIGSLLIGVAAAKSLAWSLNIPLIGVDHVHAHLYAGFLAENANTTPASLEGNFPALGLVVSGGHTVLYHLETLHDIHRMGSTIDDAVGEAYDKVASLLSLGHPGGPALDALARSGNDRAFDFPKSRLSHDSLDFSFSGLKTSVLYRIKGFPGKQPPPPPLTDQSRADIAASFQRAAVDVIHLKLQRAINQLHARNIKPRSLLVGGGVSANSRLRAMLTEFAFDFDLALRIPAMPYCMDNAAMIAGLGHHLLAAGQISDLTLAAHPSTAL